MTPIADEHEASAAREMPRGLKWATAVAVVLLMSSGLLLLTVRGEAILIDLYAAAAQMLCF